MCAETILPSKLIDTESPIATFIKKDMQASDAAQAAMTKVMTEKDFFSDMNEEQIIAYSVLVGLNEQLKSKILENWLISWLIGRKSLKRKSRKENIEMFKNLREQAERKIDAMRQQFGDVFK